MYIAGNNPKNCLLVLTSTHYKMMVQFYKNSSKFKFQENFTLCMMVIVLFKESQSTVKFIQVSVMSFYIGQYSPFGVFPQWGWGRLVEQSWGRSRLGGQVGGHKIVQETDPCGLGHGHGQTRARATGNHGGLLVWNWTKEVILYSNAITGSIITMLAQLMQKQCHHNQYNNNIMSVTVYSVIFPNVIFAPNDTFKHFCLIQNLPNMVLFLFKKICPLSQGTKGAKIKRGRITILSQFPLFAQS